MANDTEMITTKTVVDLDEKTTPVDMDLFVIGNAGTATLKKLKWSSMLAAIKTKIAEWTFQTLNTSDKTIPGALNELNNKTIRLAELSHGDAGHEFSLSSAENKKYYSYVIAAKPRNAGFPWAYAITKNGSSSGVNYFYSTSYYFSLSATISDDKISFSKTWSKGVNNGLDILLSDIDVYVYGLE